MTKSDFKATIIERAIRDDHYRKGLLAEAVNEILEGNLIVGKAMLRDYINATITFPTILKVLQDQEQIRLHTRY